MPRGSSAPELFPPPRCLQKAQRPVKPPGDLLPHGFSVALEIRLHQRRHIEGRAPIREVQGLVLLSQIIKQTLIKSSSTVAGCR
jgi:hypothetical protein